MFRMLQYRPRNRLKSTGLKEWGYRGVRRG